MQLFSKEVVNKKMKDQTRELVMRNERLVASLKKVLKLQNETDLDAEKAKKTKEFEVWCEDLQKKMDRELKNLQAYENLVDEKKEEYFNLLARVDGLNDEILNKKGELESLELEIKFKRTILEKQNGSILH